ASALQSKRRKWNLLTAVYDVGPATPTHLLRRGNYQKPGPVIQPGFLSILGSSLPEVKPAGATTGRRLALAHVLSDAARPAGSLVARVQVNRLWQALFGKGLVPTSGNLGRSGAKPSHPELLDWLAGEFVKHNWRIKPVLQLLMTSTVYRQA